MAEDQKAPEVVDVPVNIMAAKMYRRYIYEISVDQAPLENDDRVDIEEHLSAMLGAKVTLHMKNPRVELFVVDSDAKR